MMAMNQSSVTKNAIWTAATLDEYHMPVINVENLFQSARMVARIERLKDRFNDCGSQELTEVFTRAPDVLP